MNQPIILPSATSRRTAVLVWVGSGLLATLTAVQAGLGANIWWVYGFALLLAAWGWAGLWRPYVLVDRDGVLLRNVTHTVQISWSSIILIETRYALCLRTPNGRYYAWAAPAPGSLAAVRAGRMAGNQEKRLKHIGPLRPGDLLGTESGDAAAIIRQHWSELIESDTLEAGIAHTIVTKRRWDVPVLATGILLIAIQVLLFLLLR